MNSRGIAAGTGECASGSRMRDGAGGVTIRVERPRRDAIGAVFVTRNPDDAFPGRVARVRPQVGRVVVVDNGSSPPYREELRRAFGGDEGIDLLLNEENLGVATALNQGARHVMGRSCRWALTFDQDSEAEPFLVEALLETLERYPEKEKVAVIGSNYRDERRGKSLAAEGDGTSPPWIETDTVITSGSLMSLCAYEAIGPFRDDFFIDHVDDEYCLRARSAGYRVILCRRPLIRHSIGSATRVPIPGVNLWTSNHSRERRYYMARNFTVLAKGYLLSRPGWTLSRLFRHLAFAVVMAVFESDRIGKFRRMWGGFLDGARGRMGRIPGAGGAPVRSR